jgi:hypothetical protein
MSENQIGKEVVDVAVKIHSALGPGLLELVYEVVLAKELERRGLSVEQLSKVHHKQLFTYLKLKQLKLGYLLNFGAALMKEGIKRIVNGLPEENLGVLASLREPNRSDQHEEIKLTPAIAQGAKTQR